MHIELERVAPCPREPLGYAACGAAVVDLDPPLGVPMAGYSTDGFKATGRGRALRARAIWVEDATGEVVVYVVADLMSATRYLWEATAAAVAPTVGISRERLILSGTHTHSGPGGIYGQSLYDTLASCRPGFDPKLVEHLVQRLAAAILDARDAARPARLGVAEGRLWGLLQQASPAAFARNPEAASWQQPGMPGHGAPDDLREDRVQVDPRLRVLAWVDPADQPLAVLATVAGHCTALGHAQRVYDSDWYGVLADEGATALGVPVVVAAGPGGDANVLHDELHQGPELADHVGRAVCTVLVKTSRRAVGQAQPFTVTVRYGELEPAEVSGLADVPVFGVAALCGGQDARSDLYRWGLVKPGKTGKSFSEEHPQHPKVPALSFLQRAIVSALSLTGLRVIPLHVVDLGPHRLVSLPFEPTAVSGWRIEQALRQDDHIEDCLVLGYACAYGGYLVSTDEYGAQEYEGASTLWGHNQQAVVRAHLVTVSHSDPATPASGVAVFDTGRTAHWA